MTTDATTKQANRPMRVLVFLAATLIGGLCFAIQWLPILLVIVVFILPMPLLLAAVFGFTAVRNLVRPRFPRFVAVVGWLYYSLVTLWALALTYYVSFFDIPAALLTVLYAMALAYVLTVHERRRLLPALFAAPLFLLLYFMPNTPVEKLSVLLATILLPGILLLNIRAIGRAALLYTAVLTLLFIRLGYFYYGGEPELATQVYTQPQVQRIVSLDKGPAETLKILGRQLRFAADNVAGTRTLLGGDAGTVVTDPLGYEPKLLIEGRSADSMTYDPAGKSLIIAGYEANEFVVLDDVTFEVQAREHEPGRAFTNLYCDRTHRLIITGDDYTKDIGVYSLADQRFTAFVPAAASVDAMIDNRTGRLIAARWCFVRWLDSHSGETIRTLFVPDIHVHLAMDEIRRKLYISLPSSGRLWQVNLNTGIVEAKIGIEKGIRYLALSDDGRRLFAAGYFKGNVYQLRTDDLTIEHRIYAGQRVRTLHIAPGSGNLVFTSSLGAFRYDFSRYTSRIVKTP